MECNQTTCDQKATHVYIWPGDADEKYSCEKHAIGAKNVCAALGHVLQVVLLGEGEEAE